MQPILDIDLTTRTLKQWSIPTDWERDYLGAASLASRILYDYLTPDLDPLGPDAPLLYLTGPLTGTSGPAVGRFVICGRSPATGLWGESNCGGFWGTELRKAGYDGLLVTGQSEGPVYLWIHNRDVEIRNAAHIWGLETFQAQDEIAREIEQPNTSIAVIGPAGEAQIPMSVILTDHGRVAGRTGMGAVMGSKNLKGVAVKGYSKVPVASSEYSNLRSKANRELKEENFTSVARELGTSGAIDYLDYLGELPKKYYRTGELDGVYNVSGATMSETILKGVKSCHACMIACGRVVQLTKDSPVQKGPEFETIAGFGPNLGITDLAFITRMNDLCDRYGVDTISLSNTIGFAFALYEDGIITSAETQELSLEWGEKGVVEELIHKTIQKEGIGRFLAQGARGLGRRYNAEELAVQVNGLELAYHDPRGASGMALIYATSPRGGCHNQSDYYLADIFGYVESALGMDFFERQTGVEKVKNIVIHQNWRTVFNALVMCLFANLPPRRINELINAATGREYTLTDLLKIGDRAWNLKRIINNRLGLTCEDDVLPIPLQEPFKDGGSAGYRVPFTEMIQTYYKVRGWNPDNGYPTHKKLVELGLDWVDLP
jgi:aldehyde:ferredoxin oxidoreductase